MKSQTVCITGASRGLGLALVKSFLGFENVKVLAISRKGEALRALASLHTDSLGIVEADVSTEQGRTAVYEALSSLDGLSVLIHNAATLAFKPFAETDASALRQLYEVNVFAPYLLTQRLLPLMQRTHVISISSIGGVQGSLKFAGLSAYSSSKAALNCLTEMWSEEFKDTELTFNCLALGSVETEMFQSAFPGFKAACTPQHMASYIANFAFEAPSVMRGKIISLSLGNP